MIDLRKTNPPISISHGYNDDKNPTDGWMLLDFGVAQIAIDFEDAVALRELIVSDCGRMIHVLKYGARR